MLKYLYFVCIIQNEKKIADKSVEKCDDLHWTRVKIEILFLFCLFRLKFVLVAFSTLHEIYSTVKKIMIFYYLIGVKQTDSHAENHEQSKWTISQNADKSFVWKKIVIQRRWFNRNTDDDFGCNDFCFEFYFRIHGRLLQTKLHSNEFCSTFIAI